MGSGKVLKEDIKILGIQNFKKTILEICSSKEELNEKEKYYIKKYNAVYSKDYYNIAEGGTGGNTWVNLPKEQQEKLRQDFSKRYTGENNPMYGYHFSKEQREKMSKTIKQAYEKNKEHWGTTGLLGEKNKLSKIIYSPELNKTFVGIREASRQTRIPGPNIIRALKSNGKFSAGKISNKKIHQFYKEDYNNENRTN